MKERDRPPTIVIVLALVVLAALVYFFGYATTRAACGRGDENACIQWETQNDYPAGGDVLGRPYD